MRFSLVALTAAAFCLGAPLTASLAAPQIGAAAPDFTGTDSNGRIVRLGDLRGKVVVLEWTNDGCPFVQKWYRTGAMQALQREAAGKGAVWLSIISSAPGEQGYVDGGQANRIAERHQAAPAHLLLDPQGTIGHLYGAQTTPHIFIIKADGSLAYMGGADSIASTRDEDIAKAEPYAREALDAVAAGQAVAHPVTRAYGCTVKYGS